MAITYTADKPIIEQVIEKLKTDNGISQDASLVFNSYNSFRKDILLNDFDFRYFLGKEISKDNLIHYQDDIEAAVSQLKKFGGISQDVYFDYSAPDRLRTEVFYRDFYFLDYLGKYFDETIVDSALAMLKDKTIINYEATYNKELFNDLRTEVKNKFYIPSTFVSPVMERLLYMLTSIKRPKKVVGIGVFCGNAFVWIIGPCCGSKKIYPAEKILGIDINADAIKIIKDNFGKLPNAELIELITEDGRIFADKTTEEFDCIYLDVDGEDIGKGLYFKLLQKLYQKLKPGGWVLAHDTTYPYFQDQLKEYLTFVRDKSHFSESISFDIDIFGLELSIK